MDHSTDGIQDAIRAFVLYGNTAETNNKGNGIGQRLSNLLHVHAVTGELTKELTVLSGKRKQKSKGGV